MITRHLSVPAVTGAETSLEVIVPQRSVLVAALLTLSAAVTGAAANRGYIILTNTAANSQIWGTPFQGVTQGVFALLVIGDSDTGAITNSYYRTESIWCPVGIPWKAGERFFAVVSSEAAGLTVAGEAILYFQEV